MFTNPFDVITDQVLGTITIKRAVLQGMLDKLYFFIFMCIYKLDNE